MKYYELTHKYCSGFEYIKTNLSFHELNIRCAYIQLLRDDLPDFARSGDSIYADDAAELLQKIFGVEILRLENKSDLFQIKRNSVEKLDLYENWNEFACDDKYKNEIKLVAKSGAFKEVLKVVMKFNSYRDFHSDEKQRFLEGIQKLIEGCQVEPNWNFKNISGEDLTGRVYVRNDDAPDLPLFLFKEGD
jgi:hypothetical protein